MNAAETSASNAIDDCTPLTVVSMSPTTAAIDTFINEVSTTSTNIAMASRMANRRFSGASDGRPLLGTVIWGSFPGTEACADVAPRCSSGGRGDVAPRGHRMFHIDHRLCRRTPAADPLADLDDQRQEQCQPHAFQPLQTAERRGEQRR